MPFVFHVSPLDKKFGKIERQTVVAFKGTVFMKKGPLIFISQKDNSMADRLFPNSSEDLFSKKLKEQKAVVFPLIALFIAALVTLTADYLFALHLILQ